MGNSIDRPRYLKTKPRPKRDPDPAKRQTEARQPGHPNLNVGGNVGNVYGAGPDRKAVRNRCVTGFDEGLTDLVAIATGKGKVSFVDIFGSNRLRPPTQDERLKAMDLLAKYGLGTRIDVSSDDQPLKAYVAIDIDKVCGRAEDSASVEPAPEDAQETP